MRALAENPRVVVIGTPDRCVMVRRDDGSVVSQPKSLDNLVKFGGFGPPTDGYAPLLNAAATALAVRKYDDLQPRVPAGSSRGGEWTTSSHGPRGTVPSVFEGERAFNVADEEGLVRGIERGRAFYERQLAAHDRPLTEEEHAWLRKMAEPLEEAGELARLQTRPTSVGNAVRTTYPFHQMWNGMLRSRSQPPHRSYGSPENRRNNARNAVHWQRLMDGVMERWGVDVDEAIVVGRGINLLQKDNLSRVERGGHYVDRGFVSTSVGGAYTAYGDGSAYIIIPKGTRVLPIDIDVQQEIVLPRNTEFRALRTVGSDTNASYDRAAALFAVVPPNRRFTRTVPRGMQ